MIEFRWKKLALNDGAQNAVSRWIDGDDSAVVLQWRTYKEGHVWVEANGKEEFMRTEESDWQIVPFDPEVKL